MNSGSMDRYLKYLTCELENEINVLYINYKKYCKYYERCVYLCFEISKVKDIKIKHRLYIFYKKYRLN